MFKFSRKKGVITAIVSALIIWISLNFILIKHEEASIYNSNYNSYIEENEVENEIEEERSYYNDGTPEYNPDLNDKIINPDLPGDWKVYVPRIDLTINVDEGSRSDWNPKGLHHYAYTPKIDGNVVIAHFAGKKNNMIKILDKIQIGDLLEYEICGTKKVYKVITKVDKKVASYTEKTEDNRLTIFTMNMKELHDNLCIQAEEIK